MFPAGLSCGASWDKELANIRELFLGAEEKAKAVNIGLGPVVGPLGRYDYDGRQWEGRLLHKDIAP